jgi:branched-chain amino acid transport system ATP-binding protein
MVVAPLTVEENLQLSEFSNRDSDPGSIDQVYEPFPHLKERRQQKAALMSGG